MRYCDNLVGSTGWTESDTIVWNIDGAPSTGLGLEFQLNAYSDDLLLDSTVEISNVEFNPNPNLNPVPEPAAIFIFGLGLVGLAYTGRKNMFGLN